MNFTQIFPFLFLLSHIVCYRDGCTMNYLPVLLMCILHFFSSFTIKKQCYNEWLMHTSFHNCKFLDILLLLSWRGYICICNVVRFCLVLVAPVYGRNMCVFFPLSSQIQCIIKPTNFLNLIMTIGSFCSIYLIFSEFEHVYKFKSNLYFFFSDGICISFAPFFCYDFGLFTCFLS